MPCYIEKDRIKQTKFMREFLKSTKIKILLSVLLVLVMLSVFTQNVGNNFVSTVINGMTVGLSSVTAAATDDGKDGLSDQELLEEYQKLKKENADLRAQLVDYYAVKSENVRLWKFYELKKQHPDFTLVPAMALRRDTNDEFSAFSLDKGSSSGVKEGDPVVSETGLIGWVSECDLNTCKVVTILSPGTRIGAEDTKSGDTGVVTGSSKYAYRNQTVFSKLTYSNQVEVGDIITTTGVSGIYPKGLPIGEVVDLGYDTYDSSYYAVIEPYENLKKITDAAIIIGFSGQGEILISDSGE